MVKKITKYQIISLYLDDYNRKYYLREIASLLKKPHQTVKPHLDELCKEKILIKTERKNLVEFGIDQKNNLVWDYIVIAEKEALINRLQSDTVLRLLFDKISCFFRKNTFIIFGSSVEKIQKGSDIDLLIVGNENVKKVLEEFELVYNKKVHKIQVSEIENISPLLFNEIYKKHLILNNTEYIVRYFGEKYG